MRRINPPRIKVLPLDLGQSYVMNGVYEYRTSDDKSARARPELAGA